MKNKKFWGEVMYIIKYIILYGVVFIINWTIYREIRDGDYSMYFYPFIRDNKYLRVCSVILPYYLMCGIVVFLLFVAVASLLPGLVTLLLWLFCDYL